MNVFADCPLKGAELSIQSGPMKGEIFIVEGWARDIMEKRLDWPSDMGNPAVLNFWMQRQATLTLARMNSVECARVALTGLYGHVGWAGYLMLPEELGVEMNPSFPGECKNMNTDEAEWFVCSECNTKLRVHEPLNASRIHFCPNCGRKVLDE